jgi:hypothetical protein
MKWTKISPETAPPAGVEVLGYAPQWRDKDNNPSGIRIMFLTGDGQYVTSAWNSEGALRVVASEPWTSEYPNLTYTPTHWMRKPTPPVFINHKKTAQNEKRKGI